MRLPDGSIQCDWEDCTATKGPSNKWWLMYEQAGRLVLMPWHGNEELAQFPNVMHICGFRCAAKSQDEWMQTQLSRELMFHRNGMELVRERAR